MRRGNYAFDVELVVYETYHPCLSVTAIGHFEAGSCEDLFQYHTFVTFSVDKYQECQ